MKSDTNIQDTKPSQNIRKGSVIWLRDAPGPKSMSLTKKIFFYLLITAAVFISLTLYTADLHGASDGLDFYGYPYTFLIQYPGMCDPCPDDLTEINWWKFLFDFAFACVIGHALGKGLQILKNSMQDPQ